MFYSQNMKEFSNNKSKIREVFWGAQSSNDSEENVRLEKENQYITRNLTKNILEILKNHVKYGLDGEDCLTILSGYNEIAMLESFIEIALFFYESNRIRKTAMLNSLYDIMIRDTEFEKDNHINTFINKSLSMLDVFPYDIHGVLSIIENEVVETLEKDCEESEKYWAICLFKEDFFKKFYSILTYEKIERLIKK